MAGRQSIELSVARETFLILDTRGEQLQNTPPLLFLILLAGIFLKNETCAGII